jgi:hypothetical protein
MQVIKISCLFIFLFVTLLSAIVSTITVRALFDLLDLKWIRIWFLRLRLLII